MRIRKHFIVLLLLCILCFACKKQHHAVIRGFYYWKTIYRPTAYELNTMKKLQVRSMYIRFFDVDWDEQAQHPVPVAPVQFLSRPDSGMAYVPVVFITQKVLANLHEKDIEALAGRISGFVQSLCNDPAICPAEIQIDCDWTAGTKQIYFGLLRALKQQEYFKGKILSCTIRMHQVKYTTSSGIPPADKGLLMCYSMGDIKKPGARNSILDADVAKDYLRRIRSYPLPLDIALPLFEWCVLFRGPQFRGILHDVTTKEVKESGLFRPGEGNQYICVADSTWHGYTLKANDVLRLETPGYEDILAIADYTSQQIINKELSVLLFACDSITLGNYPPHALEAIYNRYH